MTFVIWLGKKWRKDCINALNQVCSSKCPKIKKIIIDQFRLTRESLFSTETISSHIQSFNCRLCLAKILAHFMDYKRLFCATPGVTLRLQMQIPSLVCQTMKRSPWNKKNHCWPIDLKSMLYSHIFQIYLTCDNVSTSHSYPDTCNIHNPNEHIDCSDSV